MLRSASWPWYGWRCGRTPMQRFPRRGFVCRESGGRGTGTTGRRVRTPQDPANFRASACSAIRIAPLPDDTELQRLRELSLDYIREAERREGAPEKGEQISTILDTVARDYFARALRHQSKK